MLNSVLAQNYVTTYSGNGNIGFYNGSIDSATFNNPFGLCIDKNNNLYVADGGNNCIRKINVSTGIVTTFAGTGAVGYKDGPADSAMFNSPSDLCVDDSGNVYISDFLNQRIRKISTAGMVSTIAGSGTAGYLDGTAAIAKFNYPRGICRDALGNIFVGDSWNHRIRKIDVFGMVSTYAGGGTTIGVSSVGALVDGADTSARFYTPSGLSIDGSGNIYVADAYNHRIRMIDASRIVITIAGSGSTGPGNGGYLNGNAANSVLNTPTELFIDTNDRELYFSDTFSNRIRKLNLNVNLVSTYAGNGVGAFTDSIDSLASFNYPRGIVIADSIVKICYVVDYNNQAIRRISSQNSSSIFENAYLKNVSIYPNPAEDIITVSGIDHINGIIIYDILGNYIKEYSTNGRKSFEVDISPYSRGIYIMSIIDNRGGMAAKIFIHD